MFQALAGSDESSLWRTATGKADMREDWWEGGAQISPSYLIPTHDFPMKTFIHPAVLVFLTIPTTE